MRTLFLKLMMILCFSIGLSNLLIAQTFSIESTNSFYENSTFKKSERKIYKEINSTYSSIEKVNTISLDAKSKNDIDTRLQQNIDTIFNYADVYDIDPLKTYHYLIEKRPKAITLEIPFKGETILVDLIEVNLLGSEFEIKADDMSKVKDAKIGMYYQGIVRGEESFATFNVFENEINGIFHNEKGDKRIEFGKIKNQQKNQYIAYDQADIKNPPSFICGMPESELSNELKHIYSQSTNETKFRSLNCFSNYWLSSYDLYTFNNSNVQNTINYLTSLFNNYNLVFSNEQIGTTLPGLYIYTSPESISVYNNVSSTLSNFQSSYNGLPTNMAAYFTHTFMGGKAGSIGGICSGNEDQRQFILGDMYNFNDFPSTSWEVEAACHEAGHILGSRHTHACVWNGNGTAIDNCGPSYGNGVTYEGGCCCAPTPASNAGTIMSYCHLNVGILLNNGFGPQPGNVIRSVSACYAAQQCNPSGGVSTFCKAATNLQSSLVTFNTATISWTNSASASSYYVMIKPSAAANYTNVSGNIGANSYAFSNLIPNTTYNVRVYTNCSNGALYYASTSFTTLNQTCNIALDVATNGTIAGAATIPFNTNANGHISSNIDIDFYKYTKNTNKPVSISLLDYGNNYDIKLYKPNGMLVANSSIVGTSKVINYAGVAGSYYVKVFGKTPNAFNTNVCYQVRVNYSGILFEKEVPDESCSIFPNPIVNNLSIQFASQSNNNKVDIIVRDLAGKILLTKYDIVNEGYSTIEFDFSNFSSGLYHIQVLSKSGMNYQSKFLKQ